MQSSNTIAPIESGNFGKISVWRPPIGTKRQVIPRLWKVETSPAGFWTISLLEQSGQIVLMPLYLYDHSGITMSTSPFSCPWDSGQVGWIYADRDMMEKEYGIVTPEVIKQVQTVLENEVETYDYYLTDQCYGFQLFEGDVEIDSCWGFLGDIRGLQNNLKEYMPEGFENIVENLQYESDNFDIEEYIHELKDTEELEYAR